MKWRALLPGLPFALAGVLIAGLAGWLTLLMPLQREYRTTLAYAQAGAVASAVNQQIARLSAEITTVARHPAVIAAALAGDARQASQVLDGFSYLDELVSIRLLTPGQAKHESLHDRSLSAPLLDMIARAERGIAPSLESYPVNGHPQIHSVTPLRGSPANPVQAVLVMSFKLQRVSDALKLDALRLGQASLVQSVFNDPPIVLATAGHSDGQPLHPAGTLNDTWSLHFTPGQTYP